MADPITAAIGAVATISAALIARSKGRERGRQEGREEGNAGAVQSVERQVQRSAKTLQEQLVERFGLQAQGLVSEMKILNVAGDAVATRTWRQVKVSDGHRVGHVSGAWWFETPGASMEMPPGLRVLTEPFPKAISLQIDKTTSSRVNYRVEVTGSLSSGDPPLDFRVEAKYKHAMLFSPAEVASAYQHDLIKHDYLAIDVEIPTGELDLRLTLPSEVNATIHPLVCFGWSEQRHDLELQRCQNGFETLGNTARFRVQDPLVGFRYLLMVNLGNP